MSAGKTSIGLEWYIAIGVVDSVPVSPKEQPHKANDMDINNGV